MGDIVETKKKIVKYKGTTTSQTPSRKIQWKETHYSVHPSTGFGWLCQYQRKMIKSIKFWYICFRGSVIDGLSIISGSNDQFTGCQRINNSVAEHQTHWLCDSINAGRNFNQPNLILRRVNRWNMDPFNWSKNTFIYIFSFSYIFDVQIIGDQGPFPIPDICRKHWIFPTQQYIQYPNLSSSSSEK